MPNSNLIVTTLEGARYRLIAEIESVSPQRTTFTIRAIHKDTGRTSVVNQLNAILTVFFPGNFPEDWPWDASWERGLHWMTEFAQIAKTSTDSSWNQLRYLERCLDEDRDEGEWANVLKGPSFNDALTQLARDFLDDDGDEERRAILSDPARFQSFVEWLEVDHSQWLADNCKSWTRATAHTDVPVRVNSSEEISNVPSN